MTTAKHCTAAGHPAPLIALMGAENKALKRELEVMEQNLAVFPYASVEMKWRHGVLLAACKAALARMETLKAQAEIQFNRDHRYTWPGQHGAHL